MSSMSQAILQKSLEFTDSINMDRVSRTDKPMMRDILMKIVTYETPMPKLEIAINDFADHYTIIVKGYTDDVDMVHYVNHFTGPNRAEELEPVCGLRLRPVGENKGEPTIRFKVDRGGTFAEHKRRH